MKKAFAWLEGNNIEYRLHDYKKDGAPAEKLRSWIGKIGWEPLVNTRGQTFRSLPPARQRGLDARKAALLLAEFPSAIRRPVIEGGGKLLIGFDPEEYRAAFK
jgi:arsenate reductase